MEEEDLFIENILDRPKRKKKVDGKAKGNRTELHLCKLLSDHFGSEFSRAVGSGNRWSQVGHMPEHAKKVFCGDLIVPEGFKWVIECKGGYEKDLDLSNALIGGLPRLDEFIEQVLKDADYSNRQPLICWKRNHKPWLCMVQVDLLPAEEIFEYRLHYRDWLMIGLEELLAATTKEYWFDA